MTAAKIETKTDAKNETETLTELTGKVGFAAPMAERIISRRRHGVELFATLALAVSLVIAATAVSIGMARAQLPPPYPPPQAGEGRVGALFSLVAGRLDDRPPLVDLGLLVGAALSRSL